MEHLRVVGSGPLVSAALALRGRVPGASKFEVFEGIGRGALSN